MRINALPVKRTADNRGALKSLVLAIAAVAIAGCGEAMKGPKRVPLAGAVTLNGQPLEGAEINFFNDEDEVGMITGPGGTFSIPTGAIPGDYKVTISKVEGLDNAPEGVAVAADPAQNPELLPPHFSSRSLTKMTFTVPAEGTDAANFDLKTK